MTFTGCFASLKELNSVDFNIVQKKKNKPFAFRQTIFSGTKENNYLNFIQVDSIFLQKGYEVVESIFSWSVMSTIRRDGLGKTKQASVRHHKNQHRCHASFSSHYVDGKTALKAKA